ncbi:MAG: TRAP transporter large permease subunit [Cytophagales bacterium]|nr:TRAP transporter large permease subunit [Cytophagales bacterium]MDW8384195.1 TRAP transporter large permease subunit [Flammeovirgaceae bacterium]
MEALSLILFVVVFSLILIGYPVAFTLGGVAVMFGLLTFGPDFFYLLALRIYGTMSNFILISVPLFVYMGVMLEKSGVAERLLESMAYLFGRIKGGLAISVIVVGTLLAASTGIVGATVVTMGLLSLPSMLKKGYSPELATGTIASAGTLGQIIPPSVVLVLLGSVLNVSVGTLFAAAILPGLGLVGLYILYVAILAQLKPRLAPAMTEEELQAFQTDNIFKKILFSFVLPMLLVLAVLGSILAGIASPTEAAAIGAFGASLLTMLQKKFSFQVLIDVMMETTHITAMVFTILLGAAAFGLVFRGMGGDHYLVRLIQEAQLTPYAFLALVMMVIFIAGFFIDFIEIVFIIVPVVAPVFKAMQMDLIWIGVLIALNLQTSFLTPPFGFSLFYLKGVAPPQVTTLHLYKGIVPFVFIQLLLVLLVAIFPQIVNWLPNYIGK